MCSLTLLSHSRVEGRSVLWSNLSRVGLSPPTCSHMESSCGDCTMKNFINSFLDLAGVGGCAECVQEQHSQITPGRHGDLPQAVKGVISRAYSGTQLCWLLVLYPIHWTDGAEFTTFIRLDWVPQDGFLGSSKDTSALKAGLSNIFGQRAKTSCNLNLHCR